MYKLCLIFFCKCLIFNGKRRNEGNLKPSKLFLHSFHPNGSHLTCSYDVFIYWLIYNTYTIIIYETNYVLYLKEQTYYTQLLILFMRMKLLVLLKRMRYFFCLVRVENKLIDFRPRKMSTYMAIALSWNGHCWVQSMFLR